MACSRRKYGAHGSPAKCSSAGVEDRSHDHRQKRHVSHPYHQACSLQTRLEEHESSGAARAPDEARCCGNRDLWKR